MFDLNFKHSNSQQLEPHLNHQNQALKALGAITLKIYQALNLEEMLQITVTEVRQLLACDRVLLYRLQVGGTGSTAAESVDAAYPSVLGRTFPSDVLPTELYQQYCQGYTQSVEDTEKTPMTLCPIELLQQVKVRAKLAVPILLQSELWAVSGRKCSRSSTIS